MLVQGTKIHWKTNRLLSSRTFMIIWNREAVKGEGGSRRSNDFKWKVKSPFVWNCIVQSSIKMHTLDMSCWVIFVGIIAFESAAWWCITYQNLEHQPTDPLLSPFNPPLPLSLAANNNGHTQGATTTSGLPLICRPHCLLLFHHHHHRHHNPSHFHQHSPLTTCFLSAPCGPCSTNNVHSAVNTITRSSTTSKYFTNHPFWGDNLF